MIQPCHVVIHWIAIAVPNVPEFQSFFRFLHNSLYSKDAFVRNEIFRYLTFAPQVEWGGFQY